MAIWVIVIWSLVLNCCAAGVGAMLHIRRRNVRRPSRIVVAAAVAALLNIAMFVPVAFTELTAAGPEGPLVVGAVFLAVFAVTLLVTLPGAIIITRKLDAPGDEFRAFE